MGVYYEEQCFNPRNEMDILMGLDNVGGGGGVHFDNKSGRYIYYIYYSIFFSIPAAFI